MKTWSIGHGVCQSSLCRKSLHNLPKQSSIFECWLSNCYFSSRRSSYVEEDGRSRCWSYIFMKNTVVWNLTQFLTLRILFCKSVWFVASCSTLPSLQQAGDGGGKICHAFVQLPIYFSQLEILSLEWGLEVTGVLPRIKCQESLFWCLKQQE